MTALRRTQLEVIVGRAFRDARRRPYVSPNATVDLLEQFFDAIEEPVAEKLKTVAGKTTAFASKFP